MIPRKLAARAMVAAASAFLTNPVLAACELASGQKTAALVELYTSEGCSSCPPADRQLSRLREALDPGADVVALALHVGYWDYIGWKDRFAQPGFAERQTWLVHANGQRTLYTPQFFVGGAELRSRRATLREEVRRLNGTPATAALRVHAAFTANEKLTLDARATAQASAEPLALYVALTESRLVSKVARGENAGVTLEHDHVVRQWIGPVPLAGEGARLQRDIALSAGWDRAQLALVAFVQSERTGRVLQAVSGRCASS
jgi:hypothetical protein